MVLVLLYGSPVFSLTGKASMSARNSTVASEPLARTPTTPCPPTRSWTSKERLFRCREAMEVVRVSWQDSSGSWWISLYVVSEKLKEGRNSSRMAETLWSVSSRSIKVILYSSSYMSSA